MATDRLLTDADREEALSWAYVRAVAGFAGYTVSVENFDRDGIDLRIHSGGELSPSIALQLKATVNLGNIHSDGCYRYDLPIRNYDRLIRPFQVPRYLVVLALPTNEADWLTVSNAELIMRRCAFWVSLSGMSESYNRASIRVSIPAVNRFDPDALQQLLEQSRGLANMSRRLDDGDVTI